MNIPHLVHFFIRILSYTTYIFSPMPSYFNLFPGRKPLSRINIGTHQSFRAGSRREDDLSHL